MTRMVPFTPFDLVDSRFLNESSGSRLQIFEALEPAQWIVETESNRTGTFFLHWNYFRGESSSVKCVPLSELSSMDG